MLGLCSGLHRQGPFHANFLVQWIPASRRAGGRSFPSRFGSFSLRGGGVLLFIYAIHSMDLSFLLAGGLVSFYVCFSGSLRTSVFHFRSPWQPGERRDESAAISRGKCTFSCRAFWPACCFCCGLLLAFLRGIRPQSRRPTREFAAKFRPPNSWWNPATMLLQASGGHSRYRKPIGIYWVQFDVCSSSGLRCGCFRSVGFMAGFPDRGRLLAVSASWGPVPDVRRRARLLPPWG